MLHRTHHLAALVLVLTRRLMPHKLLAGRWMLAFREPRELLLLHFARQAPSLRKLALPLAAHTLALGVVVLLGVGELLFVVRLSLPRADRFRERHHVVYSKYGCCSLTSAGCCSCCFRRRCGGFFGGATCITRLGSSTATGSGLRCRFYGRRRHLSLDELLRVARQLQVREAHPHDEIAMLQIAMQRIKPATSDAMTNGSRVMSRCSFSELRGNCPRVRDSRKRSISISPMAFEIHSDA